MNGGFRMNTGIILLIICVVIFVLLLLAVEIYIKMEEFKNRWNDKKYTVAILNVVGVIMIILGIVPFHKNFLSFIGFCVIIVAGIIEVIGVARQRKAAKGESKGRLNNE